MAQSPFAAGQNCAVLWSPMVVAASAGNCYEVPALTGANSADGPELVRICQQGMPPLKLLCWIYCCCKNNPVPSASGQTDGYQQCVSNTLDRANESLGGRSRYKAEQAYNMTATPHPTPMMSTTNPMLPSRNWRYSPGARVEGFEPGRGHIRVPDVVVVNDPNLPPTRDNISQIVEMKFTESDFGREQLEAYGRIHPNVQRMDGRNGVNCDCEEWERKGREMELEDFIENSMLLRLLMLLLRRTPRLGPILPPTPAPVPGVI